MIDHNTMVLFLREALGLADTGDWQFTPVFKGGSDRSFYRVQRRDGASYILMAYNPDRTENRYYAAVAEFLEEIDVRVPHLIRHDPVQHFILMEDLGVSDLWSFREDPWEKRRSLYRAALSQVARLHACGLEAFKRNPIPLMPGFDAALYQWEYDYFLENFIGRYCGLTLDAADEARLRQELNALTKELLLKQDRLIHRDFQSQNIMVRDSLPALIDFQGMRFGNPLYDVASLLYDPYVELGEGERIMLLRHYQTEMKDDINERTFRAAAAQRLMQALGAYAFLGIVKGRKAFLKYISPGLENLIDASSRADFLPRLNELALRCRDLAAKAAT